MGRKRAQHRLFKTQFGDEQKRTCLIPGSSEFTRRVLIHPPTTHRARRMHRISRSLPHQLIAAATVLVGLLPILSSKFSFAAVDHRSPGMSSAGTGLGGLPTVTIVDSSGCRAEVGWSNRRAGGRSTRTMHVIDRLNRYLHSCARLVQVYLHGATLTSFKTSAGQEVLFQSTEAVFDGASGAGGPALNGCSAAPLPAAAR